MELELEQIITIGANIGVIAGLVFLAMEIRQNNRFLAAQARYALRQYRSDIADSLMLPHVIEATHKWARGETITPEERSTGLMVAIKMVDFGSGDTESMQPACSERMNCRLVPGACGSTIRVHSRRQFAIYMTCASPS
jgi:hypothetical protein